ncbi:mitochondrial fission regulator 1-like [Salvelinus fontinalis]|uniref:mitochondrial fission regulator 1-like n=1 Tax=Salvelinus fontinalis TaxID=8038 RepID=UPI002486C415|nr:mitochondrial fission regulator 1-like [Salvelinus fontinalis]
MSQDNTRIEKNLDFGFSSKAYGSSRSIVRRIATNLPLKPCPRVHFQLNPYTEGGSVLNSAGRQNGLVASFVWIDREEEEDENDWFGFGRPRSEAPSGLMFRSHPPQPKQQPLPRRRSLPSLHQAEPEPQRSFSVIGLIQERRGKKTEGQTLLHQGPKQAEVPNMLDVLKDICKVKLRPAKSRPEESQAKPSESTDAASLIANALKRKFAHRYHHNSNEDKEFDFPASELKPFCSEFPKTDKVEVPLVRQYRLKTPALVVKLHPETPLFGQHMLKSTGQRKLL